MTSCVGLLGVAFSTNLYGNTTYMQEMLAS